MAAPAVSAAAALLLQQNALLTPDQVKARLMKTAWKGYGQYYSAHDTYGRTYNLQHDLFAVGAGYLDVEAALSSNDLAPPTIGNAKRRLSIQIPFTHRISISVYPHIVF